jgi:hypothetical protein
VQHGEKAAAGAGHADERARHDDDSDCRDDCPKLRVRAEPVCEEEEESK